jgi:hypothetical protein
MADGGNEPIGSATSFPIVEYGCSPERYVAADGGRWIWHGRRSIDLRWVAAAQMQPDSTLICMCGSGHWDPIDVAYEDFIRDWVRAKRLSII